MSRLDQVTVWFAWWPGLLYIYRICLYSIIRDFPHPNKQPEGHEFEGNIDVLYMYNM